MVDGAGLYSIDSSWTQVESREIDGMWYETYQYGVLDAGKSTGKMTDKLTMKDIEKYKLSELDDINVWMKGYACGTDGETINTAWVDVANRYGLN